MTVETVWLDEQDDRDGFWRHASRLRGSNRAPETVMFKVRGEAADLFSVAAPGSQTVASEIVAAAGEAVPQRCRDILGRVLLHRDPQRFQLCYRVLWRLAREPRLLDIASDPDVSRLCAMEKAVRRDMHKMTAFVRFRAVERPGDEPVYVAWFEPGHHIVTATAPFFRDRFASMAWSILTPGRSVHWDTRSLTFAAGARRGDAPSRDPLETLWKTYYSHIFNPARLMPNAMMAQMPKKYWRNLPEAPLIAPLIATARSRTAAMIDAAPTTPKRRIVPYVSAQASSIHGLAAEIGCCTRCPLHCHATQSVAGEGPPDARLMIVGEQPGHEEDLAGRPFVGPAGRLLDIALDRAGIDRTTAYVTNAVKHFKYEARGKQRLHKSPDASEIEHCRWWLEQEIALVRPAVVLALGVTAARSLLQRPVTLREVRAQPIVSGKATIIATVHPSYLLRLREPSDKRAEWHRFLGDLRRATAACAGTPVHSAIAEARA